MIAQLSEQERLRLALRQVGFPDQDPSAPLKLGKVLANVFDAADEAQSGELRHAELLELLEATLCGSSLLGLTPWDAKVLLTTAYEDGSGMCRYEAFAKELPDLVDTQRKRREAFKKNFPARAYAHNGGDANPGAEHNVDFVRAIELLDGDELTETVKAMQDSCFASQDPEGTGYVSRRAFLQGLQQLRYVCPRRII